MSGQHGRGSRECHEIFARLSEYLDDELDPDLCNHLEDHLDDCPPCQTFLESLRRTVDLARDLPTSELPEDLRRELSDAYRRMRQDRERRERTNS